MSSNVQALPPESPGYRTGCNQQLRTDLSTTQDLQEHEVKPVNVARLQEMLPVDGGRGSKSLHGIESLESLHKDIQSVIADINRTGQPDLGGWAVRDGENSITGQETFRVSSAILEQDGMVSKVNVIITIVPSLIGKFFVFSLAFHFLVPAIASVV